MATPSRTSRLSSIIATAITLASSSANDSPLWEAGFPVSDHQCIPEGLARHLPVQGPGFWHSGGRLAYAWKPNVCWDLLSSGIVRDRGRRAARERPPLRGNSNGVTARFYRGIGSLFS